MHLAGLDLGKEPFDLRCVGRSAKRERALDGRLRYGTARDEELGVLDHAARRRVGNAASRVDGDKLPG
jgi:hypothetical protein